MGRKAFSLLSLALTLQSSDIHRRYVDPTKSLNPSITVGFATLSGGGSLSSRVRAQGSDPHHPVRPSRCTRVFRHPESGINEGENLALQSALPEIAAVAPNDSGSPPEPACSKLIHCQSAEASLPTWSPGAANTLLRLRGGSTAAVSQSQTGQRPALPTEELIQNEDEEEQALEEEYEKLLQVRV